jgi:hypothetical protein
MFKTDGSVHHGGVKNEAKTVDILNSLNLYSEHVETRGGTKVKEDAVAGDKKISIKKKEGISVGSFDWFNTSKYNYLFGESFSGFLGKMKQMRDLPAEVRSDEEFVSLTRSMFNDTCEEALENLTAEDITNILTEGFCKDNEAMDIVINDVKVKKLYIFQIANHPAFKLLNEGFTPVLKGAGKSSRQILFTNGKDTYNVGLRLRVTSNNGINAFLGLSKANKNSQVVVKLQQDDVKGLVEKAHSQVYAY